jgi:hypothetical protein
MVAQWLSLEPVFPIDPHQAMAEAGRAIGHDLAPVRPAMSQHVAHALKLARGGIRTVKPQNTKYCAHGPPLPYRVAT